MIEIWVDGGCKPNPGKGGIGVVVRGDGWSYTISKSCGRRVTNNQAEYRAIVGALEELSCYDLFSHELVIYSDSQLAIEQLNGNWEVEEGKYIKDYLKAKQLMVSFSNLKLKWIPREENAEANLLASKAIR